VTENLEPLKPKDLGINDVEFYEVDQKPTVGFFAHMRGFWVTFSTMFKKPLTVEYPEVKLQQKSDSMVVINSIDTQMA